MSFLIKHTSPVDLSGLKRSRMTEEGLREDGPYFKENGIRLGRGGGGGGGGGGEERSVLLLPFQVSDVN